MLLKPLATSLNVLTQIPDLLLVLQTRKVLGARVRLQLRLRSKDSKVDDDSQQF